MCVTCNHTIHRAQHHFNWWWGLHSLHHSQQNMNLWSDDRNHLLDDLLRDIMMAVLALAIGVPPSQYVLLVSLSRIVQSLQHANVRIHFGPIGERREKDLAGRVIDARATFPGGGEGTGIEGLRQHIRERRQNDFIENLSRKLLVYALGRSPMLPDDLLIQEMKRKLAADDYRFGSLIESIVTSPQFLNKRGRDGLAAR